MTKLVDAVVQSFIKTCIRASERPWPEVRVTPVATRAIGEQIYWPSQNGLLPDRLAYVDIRSKNGHETRHVTAVADRIDPNAAFYAEAECRKFIDNIVAELTLVKATDPNYAALMSEANAMVLAGVVQVDLKDRLPLAPCAFLVEKISTEWPGWAVRRLVDRLLDSTVMAMALSVDVDMLPGGKAEAVTVRLNGDLAVLFRMWEHRGWSGVASTLFVVGDENPQGYDEVTRAIAYHCPSPADAISFKYALSTMLEILEEEE